MTEREVMKNICKDINTLLKGMSAREVMSDDDWSAYVDVMTKFSQKYKDNRLYLTLFEDMCFCIEKYELKKEGKKIEGFRLYER